MSRGSWMPVNSAASSEQSHATAAAMCSAGVLEIGRAFMKIGPSVCAASG